MYNKKTLSKASAELDKAKAPKKPKDIITDPMGQWKYPGLPTRIPGNGSKDINITMNGVYKPLLAIADTGEKKKLHPGENHTFRGAKYVDEFPEAKKGGAKKKKTKSLSGTNKLMLTHPLLRNYKNRVYDPNVDYFQDGGVSLGLNSFVDRDEEGNTIPMVIPSVSYSKGNFNADVSTNVPAEHPRNYEKNINLGLGYNKALGKRGQYGNLGIQGDASISNNPYYNVGLEYTTPYDKKLGLNFKASTSSLKDLKNNLNTSVGLTYRFQDGGYIEAELTDDEIEEYRKGGYIVEDISVPELNQAQKGGFKPIPLPLDKTKSETTQRVSLPSRQAVLHVKNKPAADKALKKEKKEQQKFKEELWKKYKKLPLSEKISDRVGAFINDPLGMTSRALLGEQAYIPGMAQGLHDYENPEVREKYLKELGYTPGEFDASDIQNMINPGNWVTSITENSRKGNIGTAALEGALMFLPHLPKGTISRSNIRSGANMLKNDVAKEYNKVATGNSFLTDMGVPAWKIEKPNQSIFGTGKDLRTYIAKNATDREAELYTKFGQGMHKLTPEDWAEFEALTKSGATDFTKVNTPISRIPLYYNSSEQAWNEARKLLNLKRGQIYKTPSNKSIRTWSAGIPKGYSADRIARSKPEQKIRLVIPSRYTKNLGNEFAAMPYHDPKVKFVYNENGTINLNAASENELMGNIPGGFKVIGKSAEDGMNNLIIKPVNNSNLFSNILEKLNKRKGYEKGGIVADLTPEEIQDYIAQGYAIEEVDEPELIEAQKGISKSQKKSWESLSKQLKKPVIKIPKNVAEAQKMMDSGELDYESWQERKARNIKEAEERKQARLKSLKDYEKRVSNKKYNSLTGLPNEDWRELLANEAAPLGAKFRFSQEDNFFDDYLNPLAMIGSGAQSLGEAPKLAKESDSYIPYVSAIGSPLLTGALAGVGANNTKQFLNNLFNPLASNKTSKYKEPDKIPLTLDDLKDKVAELKKIDKPDLDEGEKIFNSLKQESLDFWKTPEGRRRVQKYLDENGLSKNGITPEMYADMMSDIGYQNKTETLAMRDDLNKIKEARETLRNQRFEFSKQVWALKDAKANLIKSPNPTPEDINAIKDIDKQLNELENKISLNSDRDSKYVELEALKNVPEENAFYDIGKDKIFLGEDWSRPTNIKQSGYHEWGHAKNLKPHFELEKWFPDTYRKEKLTNQFDDYGNVSPLNKRLRESLEFENEKSGDIPEHLMQELNIEELYKNAQPISEFGLKRYTDPKSYYQTSRNYFNENDESNAFLQELLPELKKRGYINKQGDLISPQMVENLFKEYRSDAAKNIVEPIRLLDIVRPTERSVNRITDELNNLHNWMIGAGGAGAAGATLFDDDESKPELKKGGIVAELSDDEIQDYINQGYIVEEIDEPEMQSGGQMPYQIWEEKTGTPWSEAKRQGLTDGSYEQNVALAQKLLADVTSVVKENLESKPTFDYNKYDQIVSTLVQKGNTLEDLVAQQIGTKEGLMKRYPKLFSASNTKSKAVNTANIPVRSVDEILKRTPASINLKVPQTEMKSETLQYQNVPVKKLNLISDSNLKPKPVSSTVKQFERSKKVNETKLKEAEFKNYVNTIRESLTPDSVKKQKQLQNSFFPTAPKKKLTVREPLTQETTQEFRDRMMKIQQGLNLKPIQTDTEKIVPIKNFQDLQGEPGKYKSTVNLPEVNGKEFPVKKPVVKVKPLQDITKIQNSFKPEMSFKKGSKLTEAKPETEEQVVKEDSGYKVISNLTNRISSYDQSLQNLYYDYTNPKHSPEKRKQVKAAFDNKLKERNNLITTINSKKRDYAGVLDSWIDESAPGWIKKPVQKMDLSDQVEASSYKLPKFETYKEKEEKENEKFRTSKRFDDLGGDEKGSRWQFRVSASNDDPMKVQLYGTRSERNPNLNIKAKGAVMHFLDQSPLTGYMHPITKDYYNNLKPDGFVGKLEKQKDGNYAVKYIPKKDIPAKDLHKNTFLVRQEKFDNIDFNKKVADRNFPGHTYWTKKGSTKATIPVSSGKDANVYDYSSGQSVVFIFPYKGKTRYVHFAGSPNAIKKEGEEIKKLYKLQANKLVLGVADAGSYSSSVKGNITDKKLKDWNYGYANRNGFTGAGMALVD